MTTQLKALDARILKHLSDRVESAAKTLKWYQELCQHCRMLNDSLVRETVGTFNPYSCGMKAKDDALYCPTCKRCVYSDES